MLQLPPKLSAAVQEGRAVLFLGAGASLGAKDNSNHLIPSAAELGKILAKEYLGPEYETLDFRSNF